MGFLRIILLVQSNLVCLLTSLWSFSRSFFDPLEGNFIRHISFNSLSTIFPFILCAILTLKVDAAPVQDANARFGGSLGRFPNDLKGEFRGGEKTDF